MTMTDTSTAAALRSRTLPTQRSPFGLPAEAYAWRTRLAGGYPQAATSGMSAFTGSSAHHNSTSAIGVATANAVVCGVDAKQAGPPRGVPR
jgi:hypothetical protein